MKTILVLALLTCVCVLILRKVKQSNIDLSGMSESDLMMECFFDPDYPNMYSRELERREGAAK